MADFDTDWKITGSPDPATPDPQPHQVQAQPVQAAPQALLISRSISCSNLFSLQPVSAVQPGFVPAPVSAAGQPGPACSLSDQQT